MPGNSLKHRVVFAACMAVITGSLTSTFNILRNYGFQPNFFEHWLRAVTVVYPTIMFCIVVISPYVHRLVARYIP